MPNWCFNSITISGEKDKITRIKTILDLREDNYFFKSLLGEASKDNWYDENINNLGTKWDVSTEDTSIDYSDDTISFQCESAWSPPVAGMVTICKKYDVECEMNYEESGNDFYGRTTIKSDGTYVEEDYEYREGMYVLDNEWFWENLTGNDMEYLTETLQDEMEGDSTYTIKEFVDNEFPYATDKDKKEIIVLFEEELESQKEKN